VRRVHPTVLHKSFLGDGAAVLARSSGEKPASRRLLDGVEDDALIQHRKILISIQVETWGFPLHVEFSSELGPMGLGGTQAIAWIGRTVPAHFVLRALRQLWPLDVEDIAILRNDGANPDLDPQRMTLHDRTYVPSVGKDTATAGGLARTLLAHDPYDKGGFVVRVTSTGGEVTYVPLRGLRYSGAKPAAVANPEVTGVEWALRSGLATVGLGTTLWLGSVILKGG
jgi:hypothetical protein